MKSNIYIKIIICTLFMVNSLAINGMYSRFYSPTTWKRRATTPVGTTYRGYARLASVGAEKSEIVTKPSFMERLKSFWYGTDYEKPEVKESQPLIIRPEVQKRKITPQNKERRQEIAKLKKRETELQSNLANIENTEAYIKDNPDYKESFTSLEIRSANKYKTKLELDNIKAKLSRKAPTKKEIILLEDEKRDLISYIGYLKSQEEFVRRENPSKLISNWDLIVGARKNTELRLNTINTQLKKYEKLQQQRQERAEQALAE